MPQNFSLFDVLSKYGFSSEEQKQALQRLMQEANILSANQSIQEKFPVETNYQDLAADIIKFVKFTQDKFTVRKGHQERWEIIPHTWMEENIQDNLGYLRTLGVISAIPPKFHSPDAVCILGATAKTMLTRFDYVSKLANQEITLNNLILLSGERYATINIDGTEEVLSEIASDNNLSGISKLTETHLIESIYKHSDLYQVSPVFTIDTPAGNLPRPTTQTTVIKLVEWLKGHEDIKTITFISNQPYVKYQEAIIRETLKSLDYHLEFEVIGDEYNSSNPQSAIESLGSYIYAATPDILFRAEEKICSSELIGSLSTLYSKQPLIYHNLEHIFKNCSSDLPGMVNEEVIIHY